MRGGYRGLSWTGEPEPDEDAGLGEGSAWLNMDGVFVVPRAMVWVCLLHGEWGRCQVAGPIVGGTPENRDGQLLRWVNLQPFTEQSIGSLNTNSGKKRGLPAAGDGTCRKHRKDGRSPTAGRSPADRVGLRRRAILVTQAARRLTSFRRRGRRCRCIGCRGIPRCLRGRLHGPDRTA
jgi:hypothetical protein